MGKKIFLVMALVAVLLTSSCKGSSGNAVISAGSTSVEPYINIMADVYMDLFPGTDVIVQGGGSTSGVTAVRSGTADIGMLSRALREDELDLWNAVIAKDGLAIIVHPSNPVKNLSIEDIRGIYAGDITNWAELDGTDSQIHLISREEGSGTRSAFEESVMGGRRITGRSIVINSNGALRQIVSGDKDAIGFISLGIVNERVKAVDIGGIAPTKENIANDSYPLYRSFLFVTYGEPQGKVKGFIDFVLSTEGQRILENEGLIGVIQ
jgi:phosphate transport system substrate-binding protein